MDDRLRRTGTIIPPSSKGLSLPEARVNVHGAFVGNGTVRVARADSMNIHVEASPRFEPAQVLVGAQTPNRVVVTLREDELFATTVEYESQIVNAWLTIDIREDVARDRSWCSTIINALRSQNYELEMMDASAGFVRTAWQVRTTPSGSRMRRRFVASVAQTSPLRWRMKYEIQVARPGYSRGVREYMDVVIEIMTRIGI